jgi:hypothetical protein
LPKRRQDRPIESVSLKLTFRAGRNAAAKIRDVVPTATVRGRVCVVEIAGERPGDVAEKAREILDRVRSAA